MQGLRTYLANRFCLIKYLRVRHVPTQVVIFRVLDPKGRLLAFSTNSKLSLKYYPVKLFLPRQLLGSKAGPRKHYKLLLLVDRLLALPSNVTLGMKDFASCLFCLRVGSQPYFQISDYTYNQTLAYSSGDSMTKK
jgi:hypothetical protein